MTLKSLDATSIITEINQVLQISSVKKKECNLLPIAMVGPHFTPLYEKKITKVFNISNFFESLVEKDIRWDEDAWEKWGECTGQIVLNSSVLEKVEDSRIK